MRKSDYLKVLRREVAGLVILLLLFGAFAPAAIAGVWLDCNWQCRTSVLIGHGSEIALLAPNLGPVCRGLP